MVLLSFSGSVVTLLPSDDNSIVIVVFVILCAVVEMLCVLFRGILSCVVVLDRNIVVCVVCAPGAVIVVDLSVVSAELCLYMPTNKQNVNYFRDLCWSERIYRI